MNTAPKFCTVKTEIIENGANRAKVVTVRRILEKIRSEPQLKKGTKVPHHKQTFIHFPPLDTSYPPAHGFLSPLITVAYPN